MAKARRQSDELPGSPQKQFWSWSLLSHRHYLSWPKPGSSLHYPLAADKRLSLVARPVCVSLPAVEQMATLHGIRQLSILQVTKQNGKHSWPPA